MDESLTETPPKKRSQKRDKLRERLIDAAEKAISGGGLGGLKARDLARNAGCALGAIYTAFEDMDELVLGANERTLARLETALAHPQREEPAEELVELARAYLGFARAHEPSWRALFEHRLPPPRDVPAWYARARNRLFGHLEAPLTRLLPDLQAEARAALARTLFSAVHGIVTLGMEEKVAPTSADALDAQLESFVRLAAAGLQARHLPRRP